MLQVTILLLFVAGAMGLYGAALLRWREPSGGAFAIGLIALGFVAAYQL